jgi:hypothetical protein
LIEIETPSYHSKQRKNNPANLMWDVQGVLTPSLHTISPLLIISKRPVKVSSNHNIRWWFPYPIKDHSRTPSGKGCCDVEPPRGGHDKMATPLGNLGLGMIRWLIAYLMNFSQGDTIRATKKQSDSNSDVKCATVQFHCNNHNSQSNY